MAEWHIITCEYPPQIGGVSDYTKLVAEGLAEAGDEVHVWCPSEGQKTESRKQKAEGRRQEADGRRQEAIDSSPITHNSSLVNVHREFGRFRQSDLGRVSKQLDQFPAPRRLLVQWVPHGYGYRSMNLPFCFWLWQRAKLKGDRVELMVHEPFLAFGEGSRKQDMAAGVHRLMIVLVLNAATRIWISAQAWEKELKPFLLGRQKPFSWLPVPNNIPVIDDPEEIERIRARYVINGGRLVGHFGAYSRYMADTMLTLLPGLLRDDDKPSILLLGKGSTELRSVLVRAYPQFSANVYATGELPADELSRHVSACDVMLQPYQDGVSGRRTSVMTALEHGLPVVTTRGKATEQPWIGSSALELPEADDVVGMVLAVRRQLANSHEPRRRGRSAASLYCNQFELSRTIAALRCDPQPETMLSDVVADTRLDCESL